jgi:hypothetical protein
MVKICNENNPKAKDDKYICNPETGNWVLKTGAIGKKLVNPSVNKVNPTTKTCNSNLPKAKDTNYICNPETGVWVLKSGKIGKAILANQVKTPKIGKPPVKTITQKPQKTITQKSPIKTITQKSQKTTTLQKSPIKTITQKSQKTITQKPQKTATLQKPPVSLYKNQLYKSKKYYGLQIPILDKLGITYETWNNKDNTAGTCFWHAASKGLGLTFPEMANKIENMVESLPGNLKYKYKTKEYVANKLKNYKKSGFGMGPKGYCIIPKISPDTALIVFAVKEIKPKQFDTIGVFCVVPENVVPTKVIFLVDYVFLKGAHIEIMTLKGKKININWSQDINGVAEELKSILSVRPTCKKLLKKSKIE